MKNRSLALAGGGAVLLTIAMANPSLAWEPWVDPIEDRIDRAESRYDEQRDNGRRDRLEDRIDRREGRLDRRGIEFDHAFDRHERESWRRIAEAD